MNREKEEQLQRFRENILPQYLNILIEEKAAAEAEAEAVEKPIETKFCYRCHKRKPVTEFYGRYHYCKACKIKYQMQRYFSNRIKFYKEKKKQLSRRGNKSE